MVDKPETVVAPRGAVAAMSWFFTNSLDVFMAVERGALTKTNGAWTSLTGWPAPESEDRSFWDYVHPDDRAAAHGAVDGLALAERAVVEHRISTADGRWLWMRNHAVGGDNGWVLMILRDITAERRRDFESQEAQRTAGMLRQSAGVTIWRYNPDTDTYDLNPDFTRPASATDADWTMPGEWVRKTVHWRDVGALDEAWQDTLATGAEHVVEYRERSGKGAWRHMRVAFQGMRQFESGRWETLGIAQDVTDLVKARDAAVAGEQAALTAAAAKSQFLANMSHELRTPMNGVLGILHLLKHEPVRKERLRLIDKALESGVGLSDLLNDIVDYSDVEAGRLELSVEPLDPAAGIEHVLALLRPTAAAKGLTLDAAVQEDLGWVEGDGARLRKMAFHLIGNAVKFTLTGHVKVALTASGAGERRRLRLEVEDTGIGIPKDAQATLFRQFSQVDGSSTRRFGGPGLGLAITRRLARMMGGDVGFTSEAGVGSTFWMEVAAPACATPEAGGAGEGWLSGLRVLVVEDNPTNRLVATSMLSQLGATVETANDGAEGVAAVQRSHFDLIFMDIQMPVMDGVEASRRIRAMPPPLGSIPIVATTANVMPEQLVTYRQSGINGVVAKPISPSSLLAEVARIADGEPDVAAAS
ncbi:MAG TPA: response regulator [Caulobacteraceae bacterium]|nr:response regulator [Caulobacteraceae bacterium]